MNRTQKKSQKRKEREKAVAQKKRACQEERAYRDKYPRFVFTHEEDADPGFVRAVRLAVKGIDFRKMPERVRDLYAQLKGDRDLLLDLLKARHHDHRALAFLMHLGELIYSTIPNVQRWVPYNDVQALLLGNEIRLEFHALLKEKGPGGTIYHSRRKPTLRIGDTTYVVGFSDHALQQTCARLIVRPTHYAGAGDAFGFFHNCDYFEPVTLPGDAPGFTFYDHCRKGFVNWNYVTRVLGMKTEDDGKYYVRLGYCPVVIEGAFAKAKTLLPPGFRGTPEVRYLNYLVDDRRSRFAQLISQPLRHYLQDKGMMSLPADYFEPAAFFHTHVPQVIHTDRKIYAHD